VVINEGPGLLRSTTSIGVQWALARTNATTDQAVQIKLVLIDARALINNGTPPAFVLDQVADLMNSRISNPTVRAMIQAGILALKTKVVLPVSGKITPEVKLWVNAVIDGAIDGCDAYRPGSSPVAEMEAGSDKISFR
jgi:hypothetical protein